MFLFVIGLLLDYIPRPQIQAKDSTCKHITAKLGKTKDRDLPTGAAVKFMHSLLVAQGLWIWIPGKDLHTTYKAMLWQVSHKYKMEEDRHRHCLRTNLLQEKK